MLRLVLFLFLLLGGCSSGTNDNNSGDPPGGDPLPTTGCEPGSDEPICDTNLASIEVSWNQTLELCNYWNDNGDLTIEQERKVHLTIPAQVRGLTQGALTAATFDGVRVRRSPLSADQWSPSASTTVESYELTGDPASSTLTATLIHHLGLAGRVHESYTVWRPEGNTDPVDTDAGGVSFTYFKQGDTQPQFGIHLRACGGDASFVEYAQVLTGKDQVTGDEVTVLRTLRSRPPGISVGSYPVHPVGARIVLSDSPWEMHVVSSFWAQTYAAEHHNLDEHSLIDFEHNLAHYHTHFTADPRPTYEVMQHVELFHIAGFTPPQFIGVTFEIPSTGATRTISFDVTAPWRWVGETSLRETHLDGVCGDGEVIVLGWDDYQFHLATCPRAAAPGFDLEALVPLVFGHDMAQAGYAFTGSDITEITNGFLVDVDGSEVEIVEFDATYLQLSVRDGTGASVYGSLATPIELELDWHDDEVMRFEGFNVAAELVRRWAGQGAGESSIFAPVSFVLTYRGATHVVDAWDRLKYENTHHNWGDSLEAVDDELRMFWRIAYESGPLAYYVRAETLAGVEVLPETVVTLLP